ARFFASRGVGTGDRVAILMENRPEYLFALMGASKLRAVAACLNTHIVGSALAHAVRLGTPKLLLAGTEHESAVSQALGRTDSPPLVTLGNRGERSAASAD